MERISERLPADVVCEKVEAGGVNAEWIAAPGATADRVILYLHGGGYVIGSINTHRAMISRIARASDARALAIDYRLAPEHPFPAAVEDAIASYRWLLAQGYKPGRIVIAGDSAGGGLTIAALLAIRDARLPMPAGAVPISPWTDLEGTGDSVRTRAARDLMVTQENLAHSAKQYYGAHDPKDPLVSPVHANFRGLPPMLIHVGDAEILLDDATRVAKSAKAAGRRSRTRGLGRDAPCLARVCEVAAGGAAGDRQDRKICDRANVVVVSASRPLRTRSARW